MKKKLTKEQLIENEERYVEFLRKQLYSTNFAVNSTKEEFEKQRKKYDKEKLKLKFLKDE